MGCFPLKEKISGTNTNIVPQKVTKTFSIYSSLTQYEIVQVKALKRSLISYEDFSQ